MAANQSRVNPKPAGPGDDEDAGAAPEALPRSLLVLGAAVSLGVVMSTLDTTIVSVGLRSMGEELAAPLSTVQWVTTSYLLAFSMVIPLVGWGVSRFGARRMWLSSLTVFVVGSALCGLARSAETLIAFRALQGLGGGMLLPLSQTILARAAGPKLMGRVMGMAAVPGMLSPVFGPLLGGLIVDHLDWSWLFYVNLPLGAVALGLAAKLLPRGEPTTRAPLDVLSVLLLSPGLAVLTLGFLDAGGPSGFSSTRAEAELAVGALMLGAFVLHALRRRNTAPLVDLRLLRHRAVAASAATSFLLGASLFGALFLFPLYQQLLRGQDAMAAGLLLAPQGLGAVLIAPRAGRLTDRYGAGKVVPVGMVLALLGTLPYAFVESDTSEVWLGGVLLVRGLGLGATFVPTLVAAYHGLDRAQFPNATSIVNISQRVGGSIGTALLSLVLQRSYQQQAGPDAVVTEVQAGTHAAEQLVPAFGSAFWWTLGFSALALLPALALPRRPAAGTAPHH
ncbi:DHA2 family efflux MFS transporter permease subunit [Kitasatospora phosalacinea]|uniref:DHA2 family efflux MFS transporter permease subunit n=1 Tax=Kitasatospora phosalacinea TaxID=2065 RepID=A0ABW6GTH2_9ACTN